MEQCQIIGIMLIKDEDIYIERVIQNISDFCDQIIIAENLSQDRTYDIVSTLAGQNAKISLHRVRKVKESHSLIEGFAGSNTWIFRIDGDEIYDSAGLAKMRQQLHDGAFLDQWCISGNMLHCTHLDPAERKAKGYLAPPARPGMALYNFSIIQSWESGYQRMHGGNITFKNGYHAGLRYELGNEISWDESYFRCLHATFIKRSALQNHNFFLPSRLNVTEARQRKRDMYKGRLSRPLAKIGWNLKLLFRKDLKHQQYQKGPIVEKDISAFFPKERTEKE